MQKNNAIKNHYMCSDQRKQSAKDLRNGQPKARHTSHKLKTKYKQGELFPNISAAGMPSEAVLASSISYKNSQAVVPPSPGGNEPLNTLINRVWQ